MRDRAKGFSLVELLITVSVVGILAAIAMPSFTQTVQGNRADTEVGDLQHALNYARLEAINRGVTMRIAPVSGSDWTTELKVTRSSDTDTVLRTVAAMASGAAVGTGNVAAIEFNNLGGMVTPSAAVTMTYTRGSLTRTLYVCLTGRIMLTGSCG
ncbi:GspH/FimT family pseudopilin [Pseudomonas sp. 3A(2025)]